jgi:hypothetical protein
MNMRTLWSMLAVCSLVPLAAVAQNAEPPAADPSQHGQHTSPSPEGQAGGQSMAAMHGHMLEMRQQMARIHAAEDPAERERLMHEHMQSMQQHMRMMGSMPAEQPAGRASGCAEGDAACRMDEMRAENGMMRQRMRMLEDRIGSMHELMQQMLDHVDEAEEAAQD